MHVSSLIWLISLTSSHLKVILDWKQCCSGGWTMFRYIRKVWGVVSDKGNRYSGWEVEGSKVGMDINIALHVYDGTSVVRF